jgi:hypothetical protein
MNRNFERRSQHGEGDAGIAAGGVKQDLARDEAAVCQPLAQHSGRGTIFDAAARIGPLGLAKQRDIRQIVRDAFKAQERRVADAIGQGRAGLNVGRVIHTDLGKLQWLAALCEIGAGEERLYLSSQIGPIMKKKALQAGLNETLEVLRKQGFEVGSASGADGGGTLVSKYGVGAVLVAGADGPELAVRPGALVRGEVARLLDRGYQKFLKTSQFELPATAQQLEAIHTFSEELKGLARGKSLYNESLGTTSDSYLYDRVQGREETEPKGSRPWDAADGH